MLILKDPALLVHSPLPLALCPDNPSEEKRNVKWQWECIWRWFWDPLWVWGLRHLHLLVLQTAIHAVYSLPQKTWCSLCQWIYWDPCQNHHQDHVDASPLWNGKWHRKNHRNVWDRKPIARMDWIHTQKWDYEPRMYIPTPACGDFSFCM